MTDTEPPAALLRRAAAMARNDAMTTEGQTRNIGLAYARSLEAAFPDDEPRQATATPREGTCRKCSQWRPLFELYIGPPQPGDTDPEYVWLCVRDYSTAATLKADGRSVRNWLPERPASFDPWKPPPRTALERAFAYGPIAGPIRAYEAPKEPKR